MSGPSRPTPSGRRPLPWPVADPEPAEPETTQAVPATTNAGAVVTVARVGRLLGRSGWRIARQLPGARTLEREAQRLQEYALGELRRVLELPGTVRDSLPGFSGLPGFSAMISRDEQRAVALIEDTEPGESALRAAMSELLARSADADPASSNEYLFGTIISQLVPDEARVVAALATGARYAAVDVLARRRGRGEAAVLLANASTVGRAAGLAHLEQVPIYLTRLHGFGLIEFGPADDSLASEYDLLAGDPAVRAALGSATGRGAARSVRKQVRLSRLGERFWAACAPEASAPARRPLPGYAADHSANRWNTF